MAVDKLRKEKDAYINKAMRVFAEQGKDKKWSIKMANNLWKKLVKKRLEKKAADKKFVAGGLTRHGSAVSRDAILRQTEAAHKATTEQAQERLKKKE